MAFGHQNRRDKNKEKVLRFGLGLRAGLGYQLELQRRTVAELRARTVDGHERVADDFELCHHHRHHQRRLTSVFADKDANRRFDHTTTSRQRNVSNRRRADLPTWP